MNDQQLLRYSRHILLDPIGVEGQQKLLDARVLVVGAGGLGSPAAMYLAAAGVGTIALADGDTVDLTNLQRQILHATESIGQPKVESGRATLARLNPETRVETLNGRLEGDALDAEVARADVVLDCSDNFATRHAVADLAHRAAARQGRGSRRLQHHAGARPVPRRGAGRLDGKEFRRRCGVLWRCGDGRTLAGRGGHHAAGATAQAHRNNGDSALCAWHT
jgi:molybdopterin/thiamine biosynthesis adenylyltransferase